MKNTSHEHLEAPKERKAFHEMALPLDNPKRRPRIDITPFFSAVAGLSLDHRPSHGGQIDSGELDNSVPIEGTAFFYAYPKQGSDGTDPTRTEPWLITAKHVIEKVLRDPKRTFLLRINSENDSQVKLLYPSIDIEWHQHDFFDVAVCSVGISALIRRGFSSRCIGASDLAFNRAGAQKFGLIEGNPVFMIGFPHGWQEGSQDYPVVRQGIIAQMRGWLNGDHDTFLIDGSGFSGMSGGPVLCKTLEYMPDGRPTEGLRLIGLVSRVAHSDIEYEEFSEVPLPPSASESADLITVIPTDVIHETIEAAMKARAASSI